MSKKLNDDELTEIAVAIAKMHPGIAFSLIVYSHIEDGIESDYISNVPKKVAALILEDIVNSFENESKFD